MISRIRESRFAKGISLLLTISLLQQMFGLGNNQAMAITGGPSQPEVQSFEPINTNQMVDPFTGDFTYNIPLFNLPGPDGGYPFNLAYHSGAQMDQDASWVGLGWNINAGTINRMSRGIPDDFGGPTDNITVTTDMKTDWTVGINGGADLAVVGLDLFNAGGGIYYNSYRGIGITHNVGISYNMGSSGDFAGSVGLDLSFDSQRGFDADISAEVSSRQAGIRVGVGTGFNSRVGWKENLNITGSASFQVKGKKNSDGTAGKEGRIGGGGSATLSFANNVQYLGVPNEMTGGNGSFKIQVGINPPLTHINAFLGGNFSFSKLKYKNQPVKYDGIGFMYYDQMTSDSDTDTQGDRRMKDITTEKSGFLHESTKRLGMPNQNYDIYNVTGQGIGNSFRPYRSDVGMQSETKNKSTFYGGSLGFEFGAAFGVRAGISGSFNYSHTKGDSWVDNSDYGLNLLKDTLSYRKKILNSSYEPYYFQSYGDKNADDENYPDFIANDNPIAIDIKPKAMFYEITNTANNDSEKITEATRKSRKKRSVNIQPITNNTLMKGSGSGAKEVLGEYDIEFYSNINNSFDKNNLESYSSHRSGRSGKHIAGYTGLNNGGMRYVYALPAYNKKQIDATFSVEESPNQSIENKIMIDAADGTNISDIDYKVQGTNKYKNVVEKSEYAHSYLLTSVLGTDYVDLDDTPGPSDGDLGYWVKFNYVKAHNNYKWRTPYTDANYSEGYETSYTDGKGSFQYGEKEIWYTATAETKTHIAEFELSPRNDSYGAASEVQNYDYSTISQGNYYKIDKIHIYVKNERYDVNGNLNSNAKPIKTVNFMYDYSLCTGLPNNPNNDNSLDAHELADQDGKLTLKKVFFTYRDNSRGGKTPYEFSYNDEVNNSVVSYDSYSVDRWGNYKPNSTASPNKYFPYVNQTEAKSVHDERASLWNLSRIDLPSGGTMNIEYEADTYSHVQSKRAMQMFKIDGLRESNVTTQHQIDHESGDTGDKRRIYFNLEHIDDYPTTNSNSRNKDLLAHQYFNYASKEKVYFKVRMNITKNTDVETDPQCPMQTVAGYADVLDANVDYTSTSLGSDGVTPCYDRAYIELDLMRLNDEVLKYHPFTETGARHIKINQPEVLYETPQNNSNTEELKSSQVSNIASSLFSIGPEIAGLFQSFTKQIYNQGEEDKSRMSFIDLDRSYIRLNTPDNNKFGGGSRVKKVSIVDNWSDSFNTNAQESSEYGQVYIYENEDGSSNGVASYEPMIGGDEISLRGPITDFSTRELPIKTIYSLYSEGPDNENLFPGPSVGYSKVTTMSLATANSLLENTDPEFIDTKSTTGAIVHEFYTSRDFPVLTKATEIKQNQTLPSFHSKKVVIPLLIANTTKVRTAATQGYYIELNDMNGKPKSMSTFGQNAEGINYDDAISNIQYFYSQENAKTSEIPSYFESVSVGERFKLNNKVSIWKSDQDPGYWSMAEIETDKELGVDREFVVETKYNESRTSSGGLSFNFETIGPFPAFFPWPSFNWSETKTGTVVTNKIVHKSGILLKTVATERGNRIETNNLIFDQYTGRPVLTSVDNGYGNRIYNYNHPAYDIYDGMGAAYINQGITLATQFVTETGVNHLQKIPMLDNVSNQLFPGDEIIAVSTNGLIKERIIFDRKDSQNAYVETTSANGLSTGNEYVLYVYRSGRRNLLSADVASYTGLADPTIGRNGINCDTGRRDIIPYRKLQEILYASATIYNDKWFKDSRQIMDASNYTSKPKYFKGEAGVWSGQKSFVYDDIRIQSNTGGITDVDLRHDGTFNDLVLFDWSRRVNPFEDPCSSLYDNWLMTGEVTQKNPGSFDIESRDVLGNYSAALYGLNGTQAIATAPNAKNTEIGFENFEEYPDGQIAVSNLATTNLDFYSNYDQTDRGFFKKVEIIPGKGNMGRFKLDQTSAAMLSNVTKMYVKIEADAHNFDIINEKGPKSSELLEIDNPTITLSSGLDIYEFSINGLTNISGMEYKNWTGFVYLKIETPIPSQTINDLVVTSEKSHTGEKSIRVDDESTFYNQSRLELIPGEHYRFGGWLSVIDKKYFVQHMNKEMKDNFKINYLDASGNFISDEEFEEKDIFKGNFIEDWQKFEIDFQMPSNAFYVQIHLPVANDMFYVPGDDYFEKSFYDDLRIMPYDGAMMSYVYNKENHRLEAQLDANNFATFYYYNDEGSLFLIKRETEKGIITVQESRSYVREND